jgi:acylphosphatase
MSRRRVQVIISGRVQGVFFRHTAAAEAGRLALAGWIKNRRDGKVEAEVEGTAEAVEAFLAFCRKGPERARVDELLLSDRQTRDEVGFRVEPDP